MSRIEGTTVLVTGGASGIGALMGRTLLERGAAHLVIWDIQGAATDRLVSELTGLGYRVSGYRVDLADAGHVHATARTMEAAGIAVDILVNNAGIVVGKPFVDHSAAEIARTMDVNALAPMYLTRELLPAMLARGSGHVVNIASAAGMLSNPRMSVYCASKWALIGWSDSLRLEMELAGTGIKVTTVTPYYIATGMFGGVRTRVIPMLAPNHVADEIVKAIQRDKIFLQLPRIVQLLPLLRGIMPVRMFDRIVGQWFGVYDSMTGFRGRA